MPPSPSLRRSPVGDPRGEIHKRGRSLEGGMSFKERDDDLALFNELQSKESESFLLQSSDDFEDILSSRVKSFPDVKLGINIPTRGESSDLLNADGDKNDYEWLLTPPDTPLFPSLDDEPAPVNLVHSGRARTRPISISRSSTMERSQRSSRGSPSPQRSTPSPRSGSGTFRGRPSSAPHSSPVPLRPSTPSRRPSPPPVKPSTPPPRSLTPTSRRTTVGSPGSVAASGMRGTSPVNTSRGNSASPKVRAWQSSIPGFSLEAPPNLRTSLADRPASYVRGSSPASRASRGRQSMSPTASRSISSSHSQERDRLSSQSKGSIVSSGDDDADSFQSTPLSLSERPMSRKGVGGFPSGRPGPVAYSKKPSKTISSSSVPKRSFDSAMRQMDRKSPQNMFRPLLSSVPSSTFYAGKVSSAHRSMISRNSSVTTSSNASSDLAIGGAHDTEDDGTSEYTRAPFSDNQDEVFPFEKVDVANKDTGREEHDLLSEPSNGCALASNAGDSKESNLHVRVMEAVRADVQDDFVKIDCHDNVLLCCRCGSSYHHDELTENEDNICPECSQKEEMLSKPSLLVRSEITQNASAPSMNVSEESLVTHSTLALGNADSREISQTAPHEENTLEAEDMVSRLRGNCLEDSLSMSVGEESMQMLPEQEITKVYTTVNNPSHTADSLQEMQNCCDKTNRNLNVAEGAGISVLLLNRSSSLKGPLVHGRTINSSAISYDDLSYARDLTSSMRSSIGHGSFSATSSIDLTSARHGEMVAHRQWSGKRSDASSKHQSTGSSLSGTSLPVYQSFGLSTSSHDGSCEGSVSNVRHIAAGERPGSPSDQVLAIEIMELHDRVPSASMASISGEDNNGICMTSREIDTSFMADHMVTAEFEDKSQASVGIAGHVVHEYQEDMPKSIENIRNIEEMTFIESSLVEENTVPGNRVDQGEATEDPVKSSISTMSEIEINDSHPSSPKSQIDTVSREELENLSSTTHHDDVKKSDHADRIGGESTVTMEEQGGRRTRSLTLEEATDTILFCSSIVHDLAYKAASIAIEKEKENLEPLEGSRPMVTIPERRSSDRRDPRGATRTPKTQKAKKRREAEPELKSPLTENDEKSNEPVVRNVGLPYNGDSTKPPKLESKCNCTIM
ncbi:uncharacterized protein LOC104897629 [Beta vulgaris subsp. vulgaris]|uniref:uncharacterized protein LOC104897629 n=1 Tax=Beta vulgaris subsp. vulgaris TaxID=3555 RepID=UPI0020367343|nr:uncharacterized protein LOC104897629 [Beta vulgaris subsp. vulgaris]